MVALFEKFGTPFSTSVAAAKNSVHTATHNRPVIIPSHGVIRTKLSKLTGKRGRM